MFFSTSNSQADNGSSVSGEDGGSPNEPELAAILDAIGHRQRFLICSHERPDGDAVGSVLALGMVLEQLGKQVDMIAADRVPHLYRLLPGTGRIRSAQHVSEPYDAVILLECDGLERAAIEGLDAYFLINIDHHFSASSYARLNWIDRQAVCVGEMVYRLARAAGVRLTPEVATCLYTTLLTDTGGFQYGEVKAATFELARDLVMAGADPVRIARDVCCSAPMSKMLLLGVALHNLRRSGRIAWLWITYQDMVQNCASEEDCEGIVNFAAGIADIEAAAFLRELPDGRVRVSLRGKGQVNVAEIAVRLGGGGHRNAAGCTLAGPLGDALDRIPDLLRDGMRGEQG